MQKDGYTYYYHKDRLGSITAITDAAGRLIETYQYTAFGQPTIYDNQGNQIEESQIDNPYYFTGRRLDPETNLYYYRNRYYSPFFGRFITRDPAGIINGPNLYAYVGNNPVNYVDPWGLCGGKRERTLNNILEIELSYQKGNLARAYFLEKELRRQSIPASVASKLGWPTPKKTIWDRIIGWEFEGEPWTEGWRWVSMGVTEADEYLAVTAGPVSIADVVGNYIVINNLSIKSG